jgi:hypothetical protein
MYTIITQSLFPRVRYVPRAVCTNQADKRKKQERQTRYKRHHNFTTKQATNTREEE